MEIRELCYELYKNDWLSRITPEEKAKSLIDYYEYQKEDSDTSLDYNDFLFGYGYGGQIYVCFDEFYNEEYQDENYIKGLLNNDALFEEYKHDIEYNHYTVYSSEKVEGLIFTVYDDGDGCAEYNGNQIATFDLVNEPCIHLVSETDIIPLNYNDGRNLDYAVSYIEDSVLKQNYVQGLDDNRSSDFLDDIEKMSDFVVLSKEQFLESYSYLTEKEYDDTVNAIKNSPDDLYKYYIRCELQCDIPQGVDEESVDIGDATEIYKYKDSYRAAYERVVLASNDEEARNNADYLCLEADFGDLYIYDRPALFSTLDKVKYDIGEKLASDKPHIKASSSPKRVERE